MVVTPSDPIVISFTLFKTLCGKQKRLMWLLLRQFVLANLKRSALLEKKPVVIRRLSLIQYLMIYLACISLVYALWELLPVFTEYLEP